MSNGCNVYVQPFIGTGYDVVGGFTWGRFFEEISNTTRVRRITLSDV